MAETPPAVRVLGPNTPTGADTSRPTVATTQIDQIDSAEPTRRRVGRAGSTACPAAITRAARLSTAPKSSPSRTYGCAGRQRHPHRQLKLALRSDRSIHRRPRRRERDITVTGVLEHETVVCLDRRPQHLVVAARATRMPSASASTDARPRRR